MTIAVGQKVQVQGFSLVEVLVAMVIFAIGMLGIAGMQGIALKDNNDAYMRSLAVFFAYDMGDRIRANPAYWDVAILQLGGGAATLAADQATVEAFGAYPFCNADDPPAAAAGAAPDPAVDCINSQQLAQYDWYRVREDILEVLPNGDLTITKLAVGAVVAAGEPAVAGSMAVIRVKVTWDLTSANANNIAPYFTFDVSP